MWNQQETLKWIWCPVSRDDNIIKAFFSFPNKLLVQELFGRFNMLYHTTFLGWIAQAIPFGSATKKGFAMLTHALA